MPDCFHIDYETFSEIELSDVGAYRYAEDSSTEILMLAIAKGNDEPMLWISPRWRNAVPALHDIESEALIAELRDSPDALVYAHNAQFERAITMFADTPVAFMRDRSQQWRCTAAMARRAAIPDSLEKCGEYLDLDAKKDSRGKTLIRKFSILQTAGKRKGQRILPTEEPDAFKEFGQYCLQDVRTEQAIHRALGPFELKGPSVLDTFLLDIHLNDRGIPVNVPALRNARVIVDELMADRGAQFTALTGLQPTQREAVKGWLAAKGVALEDMQGDTLAEKIVDLEKVINGGSIDLDIAAALQCLRLYSELRFAAVKKVHTMLDCANADGRVRGTLLYHGAGTGRWSGRGMQPQNFKKPTIKHLKGAFEMLEKGCTAEDLDLLYGPPLEVISSCIRNFITATLDADYASIEARILPWLAGQEDALERFRKGEDSYKVMAGVIYNKKPQDVTADERQLGKAAILGCFGPDTEVLTLRGWVKIPLVTDADMVWDGDRWVPCEGAVFQGCKQTIFMDGVTVTPDHLVWCGTRWIPAQQVAHDASATFLALERALVNLPLPATGSERGAGLPALRSNAPAERVPTSHSYITSSLGEQLGATLAQRSRHTTGTSDTRATPMSLKTSPTEPAYSTASVPAWRDATTPETSSFTTTAVAGYTSTNLGEQIGGPSSDTSSRFPDGIPPSSSWTEQTLIGAMNPETCDSSPVRRTCPIGEKSPSCRQRLQHFGAGFPSLSRQSDFSEIPCYDVAHAGPRNRFTIRTASGAMIVHNCGYGMGASKFQATCEQWGIPITAELAQRAIDSFRAAHPKIKSFWYECDYAARRALAQPGRSFPAGDFVSFQSRIVAGKKFLFCRLPSGREIAYADPRLENDPQFDRETVTYHGQIPGKVFWGRVKMYGGKWVENIVQGIAADIMAHGAGNALRHRYDVFTLIHDQALGSHQLGQTADEFGKLLAELPAWAAGLPLKAEAKLCRFYAK